MKKLIHNAKGLFLAMALTVASSAAAAVSYTSVSPASGSEVEEISSIVIAYGSDATVTVADVSEVMVMDNDKGTTFTFTASVNPRRTNEVTIQLDAAISDPGTYSLYAPEGAFTVDGEASGEVDVYYIVPEPAIDITPYFSITPAPGEVTEVYDWTLTINGGSYTIVNRTAAFKLTCSNASVDVPAVKNKTNNVTKAISLYLDSDEEPLTEPGTYTLTIPEGKYSITVEGKDYTNPEINYVYTIVSDEPTPEPGDDYTADMYEMTPAPGIVKSVGDWTLRIQGDWALNERAAKISVSCDNPEVTLPTLKYKNGGEQSDPVVLIYFDEDQILTTPGTYTVTVSEGRYAITINGIEYPNPELNFVYTIEVNEAMKNFPPYVVEPAPGEYNTIDEGFTVRFDTEDQFTVDDSKISLTDPLGNPVNILVMAYPRLETLYVYPMDSNDEILQLSDIGTYTLTFDTDAINFEEKGTNGEPIVLEYNLLGAPLPAWEGTYKATPASGSVLESIKDITVVFTGGTVMLSETAGPSLFPKLYDSETNVAVMTAQSSASGSTLEVALSAEVTTPGSYYVLVPVGFLTIDGRDLAEDIRIEYTIPAVESPYDYEYVITPENGIISATGDIDITFSGTDLLRVNHNSTAWGKSAPHFTSADDNFCPSIQITRMSDFQYKFKHQWEFEVSGEYVLVIPAGYFTLTYDDGSDSGFAMPNTVISKTLNVVVSGVESVTVENNSSNEVYNLQGIRVISNASAADIQNLPAGIYVVGGKKVVVK